MNAETNAVDTAGAEQIICTEKEAQDRILNEKGFYKLYNAGKVKTVSEEEKATMTQASAVDASLSTPKPEVSTVKLDTPVPATTTSADETITVNLKKSQLGGYGSIEERLKAADEIRNYTAFQKSRIRELENEIQSTNSTKIELEKLRVEKASLEKAVKDAQSSVVKLDSGTPLSDIKIPDFDLELKDNDDILEPSNMLKVVNHMKNVTSASNKLIEENARLKNEIQNVKSKMGETEKTAKQIEADRQREILAKERETEIDGVFRSAEDLQRSHDELKTKTPLKQIDSQYVQFQNDLFTIAKANTIEEREAVLSNFFNDNSSTGNELRVACSKNGIAAPEEVDKYLAVRKVMDISNRTQEYGPNGKPRPLSVDKAYALYMVESGGINRLANEHQAKAAQRAQVAIQKRSGDAEVAHPGVTEPESSVNAKAFLDQVQNILSAKSFRQIKMNPAERKLVDDYYMNSGLAPVAWEKF